ncbi:hypothetical protein [Shewanella sp. MBTL60-007]|uniref:hypothetical protein n=1 Tax=Shewanella sp. MBTL60-007 TaxID=2815911 RepID=UPI001BBEC967|nr:hypothetical protein [Shewanella sp. MBTL60-007]GIU17443.1 hypothetical protein TUM3792_12300 [Shewanella sp. MBTL60-007]
MPLSPVGDYFYTDKIEIITRLNKAKENGISRKLVDTYLPWKPKAAPLDTKEVEPISNKVKPINLKEPFHVGRLAKALTELGITKPYIQELGKFVVLDADSYELMPKSMIELVEARCNVAIIDLPDYVENADFYDSYVEDTEEVEDEIRDG